MIKGKINIIAQRNGAKVRTEAVPYTHPESWDEISFVQFVELLKIYDSTISDSIKSLKILELFTGIEANKWAQAPANVQNVIFNCLSFLQQYPKLDKLQAPKTFTYQENEYDIPQNLETDCTWQQMESVQSLLTVAYQEYEQQQKAIDPEAEINYKDIPEWKIVKLWPEIAAYILEPVISGEIQVNEKRADRLALDLEQYPVLDLYPIANFFLPQIMRYKLNGVKGLLEITREKNLPQESKGLKSLVSLIRWRR